jgi:uncharacterized membrane protein YkvA (DUF1232 family)
MPLKLSFELSDADLEHFRKLLAEAQARANGASEGALVAGARRLLDKVRAKEAADFVRDRLLALEQLIKMLEDSEWALAGEHRERVKRALCYFNTSHDLIPDETPVFGFLDDAVMVELIVAELRHEIQAYADFCSYRDAEEKRRGPEAPTTRETWIARRRQQLQSRMSRRRMRVRRGERFSRPQGIF